MHLMTELFEAVLNQKGIQYKTTAIQNPVGPEYEYIYIAPYFIFVFADRIHISESGSGTVIHLYDEKYPDLQDPNFDPQKRIERALLHIKCI